MESQKLESLGRMLENTYNENLGLRLVKNSPCYREIARMVGNREASMTLKRMLNLN
jgi:hypothetical protein